jgi:hypothetical protein
MDAEMAAGFAAVLASLLAIALLVLFSRRIIEKTYRKSLAARQGADPGSENFENRGQPR